MARLDHEQLGEWLSAYLDGELDGVEVRRIEAILQQDGEARRMLDDLRRTAQLVAALPRHDAPPSILEDLQLQAERADLLGGPTPQPVGRGARRSWFPMAFSSAAAVALLATGTWYFMLGPGSTPRGKGDRVAMSDAANETSSNLLNGADTKGRFADAASKLEASPSPTAPSASETDAEAETLLAAATIDQKLAAGLPAEAVQTHHFANEPVRLEVDVDSPSQGQRLAQRVTQFLSEQQIADLAKPAGGGGARSAPTRFYYNGRPKQNFDAPQEQQILVRATRGELRQLMDRLADSSAAPKQVALVSGPFQITGLGRAQSALENIEDSSVVGGEKGQVVSAEASPDDGRTPAPSDPAILLQQLADILTPSGDQPAPATTLGEEHAALASREGAVADGRRDEPANAALDHVASTAKTRAPGGAGEAASELDQPKGADDADHGRLVERRSRALTRATQPAPPQATPTETAAQRSAEADEHVITMVVQFRVPDPNEPGAAGAKKPAGKRPAEQSGRPRG